MSNTRFTRRLATVSAIAAALIASVTPATAASINNTFNVTITIAPKCIFSAAAIADIAYNTHFTTATTPSEVNLDGSTIVKVLCTKTTPYTLTMAPTGASTTGTGTLKSNASSNTDTIAYGLFRDPARSLAWGTTSGTNTQAGTGTGVSIDHTVYSRIPTIGNVTPDNYADTVTVSVVY